MSKKTSNQKKDFVFKNHLTGAKRKRTAVLLGLISLLFFIGVSSQYGQLCKTASWYNLRAWDWSYVGPCTSSYNCLAYATGVTNDWVWPWGYSNPTSSQVTDYLNGRGYYKSDYNPRIISYGFSYNSILHFSKVTDDSTCRAKWGDLNLLDHESWDPYTTPNSIYGSKKDVYSRNMQISIDGPTHLQNAGYYEWCVNILYAHVPCSYKLKKVPGKK